MSQNTKIAGYNAEATPLTGVNPVHKIVWSMYNWKKGFGHARNSRN